MNEQIFTNILDYKVFNGTRKQFINYIEKFEKVNIISGNPEVLYNGLENPVLFKYFTSKHSIIIPDGVGTVLASKILKNPVAEKIAGIDIMKQIIEKCEIENKAVYFLGAEQNVLENCIENLRNIHKNLNIVGSHNGFFDLENCNNIIEDIKEKRPYAIFVAMGSPRQDIFISRNMEKLPCNIFMGVGGSFDVFAGKVKRAPKWMVNIGIEWLYRVIKEPWRIKRLISIPKFLINIIQYNRK
ncbi:WecB/TagA/CpsF family glycosyltransferase [Clostridium tyrobutyricum]|jgi:N-acetylglucosaminyldiphosphoundecaprenol N-acetyl-beta-D-mannosaminyltransferase|uniref:N-acetylglucosaminyldiphosphoundecaprenol N-acetyl-beta-D-mannosaminyltransferase n=3 Tax=Clostridium tyrobutyricum TaxID=1519 RepID=W6NF17_CLOTY|nr:WecB/TagA/CpsF family glycosyltransferase [Clostridium tyrobutyricum]AND84141.1 glycosyl transferase, WecB/TagA/CpsF family [Clostridium tyrobutyricum]QCH28041.1 Putative N-acetylmannosaminyltransferase [Clostridium tyrobutyricum]QNB66783.1 WecB/TagA/CpsF family glycosyltransferase [Clostridium tyrobutyricum]CDL90687.1 N-acetylmannosaminyltransferase [Clostridium tyrobutyricum DIVETGP]